MDGMDNLIYIDTEFTCFAKPSLISLGAVASNGNEFYVEILDYPKKHQSEFVSDIVVPLLNNAVHGKSYIEAGARFAEWVSEQGECQICCDFDEDWNLAKALLDSEFPANLGGQYVYINSIFDDLIRKHRNQELVSYIELRMTTSLYWKYIDQYFMDNLVGRHHALNDAKAMKYAIEL